MGPTSKGREERKDEREGQGSGEGRGGNLLRRRGEGRKKGVLPGTEGGWTPVSKTARSL